MRRVEFLSELREALANKMSADEIERNIKYYDSYIESEIKSGKTEEEVMALLGNPWAIAKTILVSAQGEDKSYDASQEMTSSERRTGGEDETKKLIRLVVIIAIVLVVLSLVFRLFFFAVRYAVPIAIIAFIVYFLKKK